MQLQQATAHLPAELPAELLYADRVASRTEQNRLHGLQPARLIALSTLDVPLNMRMSLSIENVHAPGDEVQYRVCVFALHEPPHRTLGTVQC